MWHSARVVVWSGLVLGIHLFVFMISSFISSFRKRGRWRGRGVELGRVGFVLIPPSLFPLSLSPSILDPSLLTTYPVPCLVAPPFALIACEVKENENKENKEAKKEPSSLLPPLYHVFGLNPFLPLSAILGVFSFVPFSPIAHLL